ncbi:MAG: ABC transporter permease [Trueperaceae bacterium]|nr:ABC transporter permease [Trueperaceae bacterium]
MNLVQSFAIAWQAVKDNRLRSMLTALGIVIGIAAVIALATMGASVHTSIAGQFGTPSTRTIDVGSAIVREGPTPLGPGHGPGESQGSTLPVFTERDVAAIAAIDDVEHVVARTSVPIASVTVAGRTLPLSSLTATTPDAAELAALSAGRAFTSGAAEAVVAESTVALFPDGLAVGDTLGVRTTDGGTLDVVVVGIAATGGGFAELLAGTAIYVPIDPFVTSTVAAPSGAGDVRVFPQLAVTATTTDGVERVTTAVAGYLDGASDARALLPATYGFTLQTNEQLLGQVNDLLDLLTGFVTGVALIALLVGSIGIANIMLVSVTERTREIGIMKAIGGQNRTILSLFLMEAVIHGSIGALIGTVVGLAGGWIGSAALDLSPTLPVGWLVAAVVIGVLVGVVAGIFPAQRAARLDPIQALRYE